MSKTGSLPIALNGDPVEKAKEYFEGGLDELVFYDITASSDKRNIMLDVVSEVAKQIFIPFSVGGGIRTLEDINACFVLASRRSMSIRQRSSFQYSSISVQEPLAGRIPCYPWM